MALHTRAREHEQGTEPTVEVTDVAIAAGAEPFRIDPADARTAALLCHGFTGSPASLRPVGDALGAAGVAVDLPRLPGHGTSLAEMRPTRWADWFAVVERSLFGLAQRYATVVVVGLSMGGALALRLAELYGHRLAGLVLINPAVASSDRRLRFLPLLRHLVPSLPGLANDISRPGQDEIAYDRVPLHPLHSQVQAWRQVREQLARITQPMLLAHSPNDRIVDPSSTQIIQRGVSSRQITMLSLERSRHVATLDHDAPMLIERTVRFVQNIGGEHES